jgi:hypothetical protein
MRVRGFILCFAVLISLSPLSFSQEITLFPDMTKLTAVVLRGTKVVAENIPDRSRESRIQSVHIHQLISLHSMLSGDIEERTYLVYFTVDTGFWKTQPHVLLLLDESYAPLFLFHGGYNGNGIDFQVVDIDPKDGQKEVLVNDYASGNQGSQTRTFILRYDRESSKFSKVFDQVIKQTGTRGFRSELEFQEGKGAFKDLIVKTQIILGYDGGSEKMEEAESRFIWDGGQYAGKMNVPGKVEVSYPKDGLIKLPLAGLSNYLRK